MSIPKHIITRINKLSPVCVDHVMDFILYKTGKAAEECCKCSIIDNYIDHAPLHKEEMMQILEERINNAYV